VKRYRRIPRVAHAVLWREPGDHPCVTRDDRGFDMTGRHKAGPVAVGRGNYLVWFDGRTDGPPDAVMLKREFESMFEPDGGS
jgi:hypothetical protein